MQYCGTEVSPSEVVVNDVDTVHQGWFHPLALGQDLCVGDEIVRRGAGRPGRGGTSSIRRHGNPCRKRMAPKCSFAQSGAIRGARASHPAGMSLPAAAPNEGCGPGFSSNVEKRP